MKNMRELNCDGAIEKTIRGVQHWTGPVVQLTLGPSPPVGTAATKAAMVAAAKTTTRENIFDCIRSGQLFLRRGDSSC